MNKEFIPYEEALALKELGFDEPCFTKYYESGKLANCLFYLHHNYFKQINAPLYQQAFRWFREKYGLNCSIKEYGSQHDFTWGWNWWIYIKDKDENLTSEPDAPYGEWQYETNEEAELACLIRLIEIVKSK